VPQALVA